MSLRVRALLLTLVVSVVAPWLAVPQGSAPLLTPDHIIVSKSQHKMTLYRDGRVIKTYRVALGREPGRKLQEGDRRTPEGHYTVDGHVPNSECHMALHLSYPNADDRARARAAHVAPGSDVEIHGLLPGTPALSAGEHYADWTYGCIALTDVEIEEVYRAVHDGTPVDIEP